MAIVILKFNDNMTTIIVIFIILLPTANAYPKYEEIYDISSTVKTTTHIFQDLSLNKLHSIPLQVVYKE